MMEGLFGILALVMMIVGFGLWDDWTTKQKNKWFDAGRSQEKQDRIYGPRP